MPELEVEGVGKFDVPEGKRLVLAIEEDAGVDILHRCGSWLRDWPGRASRDPRSHGPGVERLHAYLLPTVHARRQDHVRPHCGSRRGRETVRGQAVSGSTLPERRIL